MQHYQHGIKDVPKEHMTKFMMNGWEVLSKQQAQQVVKVIDEDCGCNKFMPSPPIIQQEPKEQEKKRGRPFKVKV